MGIKKGERPMWLLYALNSLGNVILLEMLDKNATVWVDWLCGKVVKVFRACCEISDTQEQSAKAISRYETSRGILAELINEISDSDVFGLGAETKTRGCSSILYISEIHC
eukprot:gnl/Chilomastix_caulleri/2825.p1 GENE.gnl/Chilomastix_caulleri/2825~~gnl/Chilomastix_caulleri/2825.p1  ORF type:complete len:110 (+),score=16.22 gnl/Chilomastix_caulleri/2825:92-421(+)